MASENTPKAIVTRGAAKVVPTAADDDAECSITEQTVVEESQVGKTNPEEAENTIAAGETNQETKAQEDAKHSAEPVADTKITMTQEKTNQETDKVAEPEQQSQEEQVVELAS